jgi:hypothetical protein
MDGGATRTRGTNATEGLDPGAADAASKRLRSRMIVTCIRHEWLIMMYSMQI